MKRLQLAFVCLALSIFIAACAPTAASDAEPMVVVINGPQGATVEDVATSFADALRELGTPGFDVLRNVAIVGVEQRRNLFGSQAVPSAARIGRSFGAPYALMLGAVDVQREVIDAGRNQVRVIVSLAVEGDLVRASDEQVVASITSPIFAGERVAEASEPLPELLRDPLVEEVATAAAVSLAPTFREVITTLVSENSSE